MSAILLHVLQVNGERVRLRGDPRLAQDCTAENDSNNLQELAKIGLFLLKNCRKPPKNSVFERMMQQVERKEISSLEDLYYRLCGETYLGTPSRASSFSRIFESTDALPSRPPVRTLEDILADRIPLRDALSLLKQLVDVLILRIQASRSCRFSLGTVMVRRYCSPFKHRTSVACRND